jgi:hypothetical protein
MNKKERTITSILSWMSILTLSLASITIAINSPFLRITLAQQEGGEDLVEMKMDNGTEVSVANGSGMILGDGTHVIENSTMTMMENGTVQSENAF